MNARRRKIQKVLEIREQNLEKTAAVLQETRSHRDQVQAYMDEVTRTREEAERRRDDLLEQSFDVSSWIEADLWLSQRKRLCDVTHGKLIDAEHQVMSAQEQVVVAHAEVRRIELLDDRFAACERKAEARLEQKLTDELAMRKRKLSR